MSDPPLVGVVTVSQQPLTVMNDQETIARFIFLRSQGWSFNRITVELNISKPTLIKWSREFRFEIQNQRAIPQINLATATDQK